MVPDHCGGQVAFFGRRLYRAQIPSALQKIGLQSIATTVPLFWLLRQAVHSRIHANIFLKLAVF